MKNVPTIFILTLVFALGSAIVSASAPMASGQTAMNPASGILPSATQDSSYDQIFSADGRGLSYQLSGTLPDGLSFAPTDDGTGAEISGTPGTPTTIPANFTITATDPLSGVVQAVGTYTLNVDPIPPTALAGRPTSTVNVSVAVNGGTATPASFKIKMIASGSRPTNFSGNAAGVPVSIDAYKHFAVNVSSLPGYIATNNGNCRADGLPAGGSTLCAVTETFTAGASTTTQPENPVSIVPDSPLAQMIATLEARVAALIEALNRLKSQVK